MTRRWFSKLITAAPVTAPLASKVLAEEGATKTLALPDFTRRAIPPNWNVEGNTLIERSLAKGFRSTPKSEHYKFLEHTLKQHLNRKHSNCFSYFRKIHDCNPGYIPQVSAVQHNKQRFRLRYQTWGQKWQRDQAVKLWNLRRKTTLAEEWESANNEIFEACSIEL